MQVQDEVQFQDYEAWLAAARAAQPAARHNKRGLPGWVQGYGSPEDEEFVTGPDMQADVVAVWCADDGFGWVAVNPETAARMKAEPAESLVYFKVTEYNVFSRKRGATHLMAANGALLHAKVARAAALHIDADTVLLEVLSECPSGIAVVLSDEEVEAA